MFRTVLMAAVLSLASTVTASAGWVTSDLRLRAGPGTNHNSYGTLRACSRVDVQAQRGSWLLVVSGSGQGWVSARYVSGNQPRNCNPHRNRNAYGHQPGVVIQFYGGDYRRPHQPRRQVDMRHPSRDIHVTPRRGYEQDWYPRRPVHGPQPNRRWPQPDRHHDEATR